MHPTMMHELAKIKIAEQLQYAERQRLARLAVSDRPRPIDFAKLGTSLRQRLFGDRSFRPAKPAGAGA
jgi:acetyl-CoA carboxylase alpha subunit